MYLRRLYKYNSTLGFTLPAPVKEQLKLDKGDYVELWFTDAKTLILRKHELPKKPE